MLPVYRRQPDGGRGAAVLFAAPRRARPGDRSRTARRVSTFSTDADDRGRVAAGVDGPRRIAAAGDRDRRRAAWRPAAACCTTSRRPAGSAATRCCSSAIRRPARAAGRWSTAPNRSRCTAQVVPVRARVDADRLDVGARRCGRDHALARAASRGRPRMTYLVHGEPRARMDALEADSQSEHDASDWRDRTVAERADASRRRWSSRTPDAEHVAAAAATDRTLSARAGRRRGGRAVLRGRIRRCCRVTEKMLVWHLYQAALAGRDIFYDQRYAHNLEMRDVLEAIVTHAARRRSRDRCRDRALHEAVLDQHRPVQQPHRAQIRAALHARGVRGGRARRRNARRRVSAAGRRDARRRCSRGLQPMFFDADASIRSSRTRRRRRAGHPGRRAPTICTPASRWRDLDGFDERHPLNSRLVKHDGRLVEEVYRVGGRYGRADRARSSAISEAAMPYATAPMAEALGR